MTEQIAARLRDYEFSYYIQTAAGVAVDITGWTWEFRMSRNNSPAVLLTGTIGAGLSVAGAAEGRVDVAFLAAAMAMDAGRHVAELIRTDTGADSYGRHYVALAEEGQIVGGGGDIVIKGPGNIILRAINAPAGPPGSGGGGGGDGANLTFSRDAATVTVLSDTGTDAILPAATTSLAGVMAGTDKAKLDGIESAATNDQTAAEILAKLLTVDGGGSLLDADFLDGQSSAFYATASSVAALVAGVSSSFDTLLEIENALALKQPLDSDLTAIAALSTTAFGRSVLEAANAGALRTLGGLVIGTDVQAFDADLATWAGLTPSANHQTLVTQTFAQMRASLDLEAGTDFYSISAANAAFQPLDGDLTTIAGLAATSDNFMQAKAGAWASRTVAQVKTDLGLTGTNSGDQTSIAGISGTKAQFDTAISDGNGMYVGDTLAGKLVGGNWKVFYTDGSGVITELALGAAGTLLMGNGASAAPTFGATATDAEVRAAATGNKPITAANLETASAFVALTSSAGSIAIDWDAGINFSHTFTENTVFANPTNGQPGTWRTIRTTQHASSPKTLGVGSQYHSVGGAAVASTMTNSATDHYTIMCITSSLFVIFPSLNVADVP